MFTTICGVDAEVYPDIVAAMDALAAEEKPEVIVLGRMPRRAGAITALVRSSRSSPACPPVP